MPLETYCTNPDCARRFVFPDSTAGRSVRCQSCGQTFVAGASTTAGGPPRKSKSAVAPAVPAAEVIGSTFGRFVVKARLGAGAFGTVYRAFDPILDRDVALKVPNPGVMADPKRVERFLREAKAAAGLRHPHIVAVFDAGKDADRYYIASAFIEGKPLADTIPEGGDDFARAARLVRELAEALAYAHSQGVVHRDVKPANIMVDAKDAAHLMDFGLATRQEETAKLTSDGAVMGTPSYMAPEQAAGQKGEAKPAADQYAAGVVLYELLTGRTPFEGPLQVVLHNVIHTAPDSPRKYVPDIPKDLETICLKAMAKRPEDRYPDCQALADDLRRWMEGEPVIARPLRPWERLARWVRKEPKLAGAVAVVTLVLLGSVVLVSGAARRADAARQQAERDAADARAAEKRAADALAEADAARKREEVAAGETLGALGSAAEERKKALAERTRADEAVKQAEVARREAEEAKREAKREVEGERSRAEAEGKKAEAARVAAEEAKRDADDVRGKLAAADGRTRSLLDPPTPTLVLREVIPVRALAFSPDGERILVASHKTVRAWDAVTGKLLATFAGHTDRINSVAFSPDGKWVVTSSSDKSAGVWNSDGKNLMFIVGHQGSVNASVFGPDGKWVVTGSSDETVAAWMLAEAKGSLSAKRIFSASVKGPTTALAFNSDGNVIVAVGTDKLLNTHGLDAATGKHVYSVSASAETVNGVAVSPGGTWLLSASRRGISGWDAGTGRNRSFNLFTRSTVMYDVITAVSFSPDGKKLLIADTNGSNNLSLRTNSVRVVDVSDSKLQMVFPQSAPVSSIAWSKDGSRLAFGGEDGTVQIYRGDPPMKEPPIAPDPKPK